MASVESWTPESSTPEELIDRLNEASATIAKTSADIAAAQEDLEREVHWYRRLRAAYRKHLPIDDPDRLEF